MALCVNSATVGLQTGRILLDYTSRAEVPLLLICAFVRVAVFVLIYSGLLAISVHLENPLGDDPAGPVQLAPGQHRVEIRKAGRFPVQRTVAVDADTPPQTVIEAELLEDPS